MSMKLRAKKAKEKIRQKSSTRENRDLNRTYDGRQRILQGQNVSQ